MDIANHSYLPVLSQSGFIEEVKCSLSIHKDSSNGSFAEFFLHLFQAAKPCNIRYFWISLVTTEVT